MGWKKCEKSQKKLIKRLKNLGETELVATLDR